jgi:hypothetical protein
VADITATASTGVQSVTINSTGAANAVDTIKTDSAGGTTVTSLTVNAATNLTATLTANDFASSAALKVSGAATSVNLGTAGNFKTIDASGLTAGGLTIAGGTNTTSFVGGAGNDNFTTASYTTKAAGMVNAGTGTDILTLAAATDLDTATEAGYYVGFETLRTAGAQDMSLLSGITAVQLTAAGAHTQMNATQASSVQLRADVGATSFALTDSTGTSDSISITMGTGALSGAGAATEAVDITGALTINGFESLTLTSNHGESATVVATAAEKIGQVASLTADKLTSITLKGTSIDLQNAATTKAVTIDASALTGNGTVGLTLAGNLVATSTVTGSGVVDAITLGTAGSTYNLGAGNDTVTGTLAQYRTGSTYNTIDGGAGTETLTISDGAALTIIDDDFKGMTNVEKITITDTVNGAQSITTGGWFDGNFKAGGATFTTTSAKGTITFNASSFTGKLTVTTTSVGTDTGEGRTSVTTGAGDDTISVTTANATTTNSVVAGAGNDTITHVGGTGSFSINGGKGADTMTGLAGSVDTFVFANSGDTGTPSDTNFDTITNWVTTSDVIDFASNVTVVQNATSASAGVAAISAASIATFNAADTTLAQRITAVEAGLTKSTAASSAGTTPRALDVAVFNYGADAFLFITDGTAGVGANDTLIKLTGVQVTSTFTIAGGDITAIS